MTRMKGVSRLLETLGLGCKCLRRLLLLLDEVFEGDFWGFI